MTKTLLSTTEDNYHRNGNHDDADNEVHEAKRQRIAIEAAPNSSHKESGSCEDENVVNVGESQNATTRSAEIGTTSASNLSTSNNNDVGSINNANQNSNSTLYIGGLDPRVLKVHLEKMLGRYGTIQRLHCCYRDNHNHNNNNNNNKNSNNNFSHRGPPNHAGRSNQQHHRSTNSNHHTTPQYWFAFCQMATVAQADAARRALDGQVLLGKNLVVRPAHNDAQPAPLSSTSGGGAGMLPNTGAAPSAAKLESQQRSVEDKIAAIKRKLQQHQQLHQH